MTKLSSPKYNILEKELRNMNKERFEKIRIEKRNFWCFNIIYTEIYFYTEIKLIYNFFAKNNIMNKQKNQSQEKVKELSVVQNTDNLNKSIHKEKIPTTKDQSHSKN